MDHSDARFSCRQMFRLLRAERPDNDPLLLNRFRIIKRRVAKRSMLSAFDAHNFCENIRDRKFQLISRQRYGCGVNVNGYRTKMNLGVLGTLLREQPRGEQANKNDQPAFQDRLPFPSSTACAAINATSRSSTTPSPFTSKTVGDGLPFFRSRASAKESKMSTFPSWFKSSRA